MAHCSITQKITSILLVVLPSVTYSAKHTPKLRPHAVHANNKCNITHAVASCRRMLRSFMCSYLQ